MPLTLTAPPTRYNGIAIAFHWLLALMIVGSFCVGAYMSDLQLSVTKLKLYNYHILALSALRLLWRLTHRPPPAPRMPAWQKLASQLAHGALYVLFFAVPLMGWAYSSSAGFPIVLFGVWPLPDFVAPDKALAEVLKARHGQLAWALAVVVMVHVAGALKHQFIDRDGLLRRMWPGRA
jgi:cytochrome b561